MSKDETEQGKTKVATLTQVTDESMWPEGHSPEDVLNSLVEDIPDLLDIIIVARYRRDSKGVDKYAVSCSDQALISKLGLLELAKSICTELSDGYNEDGVG